MTNSFLVADTHMKIRNIVKIKRRGGDMSPYSLDQPLGRVALVAYVIPFQFSFTHPQFIQHVFLTSK